MSRTVISTTTVSWFLRGFFAGLLLSAALNALWYFVRSEHGGNLLGRTPEHREALGFPVELWESGNAYDGYFVDYRALLIDGLFGIALGAASGLLTVTQCRRLNTLVSEFERSMGPPPKNFQVSLRGLILATTMAAVLSALASRFAQARAEVLGGIYLLGPWLLIAIAFVPRRIPWQQRAAILIPSAALMMFAAIIVGSRLTPQMEFDKVLLGIFICWTPQTVLVALGLSLSILLFAGRVGRDHPRPG